MRSSPEVITWTFQDNSVYISRCEVRASRSQIKSRGGKLIKSQPLSSEITTQLYQLPDGSLWAGDGWYRDNQAVLYLCEESPF